VDEVGPRRLGSHGGGGNKQRSINDKYHYDNDDLENKEGIIMNVIRFKHCQKNCSGHASV